MFGVQLEKNQTIGVVAIVFVWFFLFFFLSSDSVLELHLKRANFEAVSQLFKSPQHVLNWKIYLGAFVRCN